MIDLLLVFSPVGEGHAAAAHALAEAARARGLTVAEMNLFEHGPRWFVEAYRGAHFAGQRAAPSVYGRAYFSTNHRDKLMDPLRRAVDGFAFRGFVDEVSSLAPRAILATHHLPLAILGPERLAGRLCPLGAVVTDYTAHACWAEEGTDRFFVANAIAEQDLVEHGVARRAIARTGIPVREAFDRVPGLRPPAPGEPLRVLVTSGGFGVGPLEATVCGFAGLPGVELTVVCGRKEGLAPQIARAASRSGVRAEILGFEPDMARRMAEAHLIIGKAGGLTLSEALTSGRPLVITGAVPGNEKINERYVVEHGAAVSASPAEAGRAALLLRDRGLLGAMAARARALVPTRAATRVLHGFMGTTRLAA